MLGIEDPWVWSAYLLCLLSSLLCVIYGALTWHRGDEPVEPADQTWQQHEQQVEDEI